MPELATLNTLDRDMAAATLRRCCGSSRWVEAMLALRPFESEAELRVAGERVWATLEPHDWKEAFAAHPRIGGSVGDAPTAAWSKQEQAGAAAAPAEILATLARRNAEYERRFGWVFLICATGKSAQDVLAALESRMQNDPSSELRVAAAEQAKITSLRLAKLLRDGSPGGPE